MKTQNETGKNLGRRKFSKVLRKNGKKNKYGIIVGVSSLPTRNLLKVPHKGNDLLLSYPTFGRSSYGKNLNDMMKKYFHSKEFNRISFREPTTTESISASAFVLANINKSRIFDPSWGYYPPVCLQLGAYVSTLEGVFINPPKDEKGNSITDEEILKSYLDKSKKFSGVWLYDGKDARDFGFASHKTFEEEQYNGKNQDVDKFLKSGLARLLEHTKEKVAKKFQIITSKMNAKSMDIDLFLNGFGGKPHLDFISLHLFTDSKKDNHLSVANYQQGIGCESYRPGYAFGVLDSKEIVKNR